MKGLAIDSYLLIALFGNIEQTDGDIKVVERLFHLRGCGLRIDDLLETAFSRLMTEE